MARADARSRGAAEVGVGKQGENQGRKGIEASHSRGGEGGDRCNSNDGVNREREGVGSRGPSGR